MTIETITLERSAALFPDLINNYELFHEAVTPEQILKFKEFPDNSTTDEDGNNFNYYSNYPHIDDFLKSVSEDDKNKTHTLRVPIDYIFSSDKDKSGFDRPQATYKNNLKDPIHHLSVMNGNGKRKGYKHEDAGTISGALRPYYIKGKLFYQIVKEKGNNRLAMKLVAHRGKPTEILMTLRFHKLGKQPSEMIKDESERHTTDAQDTTNQNEAQKFISAYLAGREHDVHTFNFLKNHQLDYVDVMKLHGVSNAKKFLTLTSISGINKGKGNLFFKEFGEQKVVCAIQTVKEIALLTNEKIIGMSSIEALSKMFSIFTECGKGEFSKTALFTEAELQTFFVNWFKRELALRKASIDGNFGDMFSGPKKTKPISLSMLSATRGVKDLTYICVQMFWPDLPNYWNRVVNKKATTFTPNCWAVTKFLEKTDVHLRKEIIAKIF